MVDELGEASVIEKVLTVYDDLPNSERRIADYILAHPNAAASMSAKQIAQSAGSSAASMSRFVKSLGFSSFAELSLSLPREDSAIQTEAASPAFTLDNLDEAINYALSVKIEELTATARNLKESGLAQAINIIGSADLTVFAGVGNTISLAQNAAFKLTQTGHRAVAPSTSDGSSLIALALTEKDALVVISTTGLSKRLLAVIENAKKSKTPVIVITDREDSELGRLADIVVKTATHDRLLTRNLRFSQNPINFVIELITVLLFHGSTDAVELAKIFDENMVYDKVIDREGNGASK